MSARVVPLQGSPSYRQLWRVVDGAVRDTFHAHPDYLSERGRRKAEAAIVKRVTGAVLGYAEAAAAASAEGRSGSSPAAVIEEAALTRSPRAGLVQGLRKLVGRRHPASAIHTEGSA